MTRATASLEDAQLQMEQVEDLLATIMDERAAALDAWGEPARRSPPPPAAGDESSSSSSSATRALGDAPDASEEEEDEDEMEENAAGEWLASGAPEDEERKEEEHADDDERALALTLRDARSPTLALALLEGGDRPVQWNLISPWSEADEDDVHDDDDDDDGGGVALAALPSLSPQQQQQQRGFFKADSATASSPEPEAEMQIEERLRELIRTESGASERDELLAWDVDADEDDEEFEVFSALARTVESIDELFEEQLDARPPVGGGDHEEKDDCHPDDARTSVASTLDDSCDDSPRVSAASRFLSRRLRAQSYTGTAATSMQSAFAKFRSRTLSSTRSSPPARSSSASEVEDGGDGSGSFYADDDSARGSNSSRRSLGRYALSSRLGSVGSLKMAAGRMSFLRFRSSSATTATSEDSSYASDLAACGSPSGDVHSAPSLSTISSSASPASAQQQPSAASSHLQMQALKLKASAAASKAAGYLNAASSEAARKLKSRSLRSPAKSDDGDGDCDNDDVDSDVVDVSA